MPLSNPNLFFLALAPPLGQTAAYYWVKVMFWQKRDKEKERFYLLPGQGGRGLHRKRKAILAWSILAGLLVSGILAIGLYFANTRH